MPITPCLPVTALCAVQSQDETLLLSGAGSFLTIHDAHGENQCLGRLQIFQCQSIHGIRSWCPKHETNAKTIIALIWGGSLLNVVQLTIEKDDSVGDFRVATEIRQHLQTDDWILDVTASPVGQSVFLLTAHDALYELSLDASPQATCLPEKVSSGPETLLYSAQICLASAGELIVAAGTVFGEILVWTYTPQRDARQADAQVRHIFLGHQGSIFGVCISAPFMWRGVQRRLLASCSDDRTIRVWDITSYAQTQKILNSDSNTLYDTGFGSQHQSSSSLCKAWGHLSRIWNVSFLPYSRDNAGSAIRLVSTGEDGVCQSWDLELDLLWSENGANSQALRPVVHDRHHAGKNIWSSAHIADRYIYQTFSGGADGQIVSREQPENVSASRRRVINKAFKDIQPTPGGCIDGHRDPRAITTLKQYLCFDDGTIVATDAAGNVMSSHVDSLEGWSLIPILQCHKFVSIAASWPGASVFLIRDDGALFAYSIREGAVIDYNFSIESTALWLDAIPVSRHNNIEPQTIQLLVNCMDKRSRMLTVQHECPGPEVVSYMLQLPPGLILTCGFYNITHNILICGSRSGALAILSQAFKGSSEFVVRCHVPRIHGSDSVTSITELPSEQGSPVDYIFCVTTGRDGTISCHKILVNSVTITLRTVHRTSPPLGPYIEGAHLSTDDSGCRALTVYGFKSKDFVVWNESDQRLLMSVECGGAHRNWAYCPSLSPKTESGTFLWTKAGTINAFRKNLDLHHTLQYGGHGREIKAMSFFRASQQSKTNNEFVSLVATGAEDTGIRIFRCSSSSGSTHDLSSFECLSTIPGHTTGLQHLAFSSCGRYLFSSGGAEEFYVWRLQDVPLLNVGILCVAKLSKTAADKDARIMSFDIMSLDCDSTSSDSFEIALAYSTGKVKVLRFTTMGVLNGSRDCLDSETTLVQTTDCGQLEVIAECEIGPICLTQIQTFSHANATYNLIGATDGNIRLAKNDLEGIILTQHTHQSNIASLVLLDSMPNIKLAVTGGDDNALSITALHVGDECSSPCARTITVADAHAAAVTAVEAIKMYADSQEHYLIVTTGNDQRVHVWHLSIPAMTHTHELESASATNTVLESAEREKATRAKINIESWTLTKISRYWTDVADVSNMKILNYVPVEMNTVASESRAHHALRFKVLIVGVGMQVLDIEAR